MKYIFLVMFTTVFYSNAQDLDKLLESKLNSTTESPVNSISIYVKIADSVIVEKAVGLRQKNGEKAKTSDQFRIASSTKLFVATIILQLEEEGKLHIDDKVYPYLKDIEFLRLDEFHYYQDSTNLGGVTTGYSKAMTIKQLLSHRSGLADIFNDREAAFFSMVMNEPEKEYHPKNIVNLYFEYGLNKEAKFKPDEGWHYSDMNYVLLGLLIEKLDGKLLSQSIRDRILDPLGLKNTYFEFYEYTDVQENRLNQYVGTIDFNNVNTSFDWSGGGLVSTHQDLAIFISALFDNRLISEKSLRKMTKTQATIKNHLPYGLGVYESIYNEEIYYGHYGFYGTYIGYSPNTKAVLSYCISQALPSFYVYEYVDSLVMIIQ
ncbi:serine hydrolase domain-containing protein [Flagellimonas myxillae]|uniref:serine hydrolase domain-containing protein n=1 Tax=Flagellimonas myxillae TaxID=2942214 RepID=UPI00201F1CE6|nr:serine hydrolase domain-containing protein [Muricauda myxillae]MCL6267770.1 beta-lactamase family protein [Muricauda myxillae]